MTTAWRGDVIIAGGGPAGSTCATLLARSGRRTLLVDDAGSRPWRPVEILSPHTLRLLRQHGLFAPTPTMPAAACLGVEGRWSGDVDFFDYHLLGCDTAIAIGRPNLDAALARGAADAGVACWDGWLDGAARAGGEWTVAITRGGVRAIACAPLLIEAIGRSGGALTGPTRRRYFDRLIGLACRVTQPAQAATAMVLEASANGWWYASCDGSGDGAAVFMTDADLLRDSGHTRDAAFRRELAATQLLRRRVPAAPASSLHGIDARTSRREQLHGPASIAIGDAAYSVDPLSGAGIQRCVETAAQGASAADRFLAGDPGALETYAAWASADFEQWLARKDDVYAEVDPELPKGAFWRRRVRKPA
jgi:2-polyprenyl-6-methoxyphenol hydroxylase-like FAD-dependent oxidoreductase